MSAEIHSKNDDVWENASFIFSITAPSSGHRSISITVHGMVQIACLDVFNHPLNFVHEFETHRRVYAEVF